MKPFTISLSGMMHVLICSRKIAGLDVRLVEGRIKAALQDEKGQGNKYTPDSMVAACAVAGITLTDDEKDSLAYLDAMVANAYDMQAQADTARDEVLGVTPEMKAAATAAAAEMNAAEAAAKPADGVSRVPAGMGGKNV